MDVKELNKGQLRELKERFLFEQKNQELSMYEIAIIDDLVSDQQVFDEYKDINFVNEDFFCTDTWN